MEVTEYNLEFVKETLDEIRRNQEEYERIGRSRWSWTPWALRKQYRLCKASEPLFARMGMGHPPMHIDTAHGFFYWWLRR